MQKSLGVYHDFACQTIASTKGKSLIILQLFRGHQTRKQDKRQTRPKKIKKNRGEIGKNIGYIYIYIYIVRYVC